MDNWFYLYFSNISCEELESIWGFILYASTIDATAIFKESYCNIGVSFLKVTYLLNTTVKNWPSA